MQSSCMITHSQSAIRLFVMLQGSEMFYQNYSHTPWEGPVVILMVQLWFFN